MKLYTSASVKSIDKKEGIYEVMISSGEVDRMGDTINPKGWYLKNYKKNPVILWSHSSGGMFGTAIPPVGRADRTWLRDGKELWQKQVFASTPFAQELKLLVDEKCLSAQSVGFLPLVEDEKKGSMEMEGKMYRRVLDKELKAYKEKGFVEINGKTYSKDGEHFDKQELLEVSWVDVPALPSALVSAKKMNLGLVTKALEQEIKENPNDEEKEPEKEPEKKVEEVKTESKPKEELPEDDSLEKRISKLEEVISDLQEVKNPKDATPKEDEKGRDSFVKPKSKKSETERMLIMFDKMIETLLRKLRQ